MKKLNIIYYVVIYVLIIFIFYGCQKQQNVKQEIEYSEVIPVQVSRVKTENIMETLEYAATIKAAEEVLVFPKVSGKVIEKLKKEADSVEQKEPILFIDRDEVGFNFEKAPVESPISGIVGRVYVDLGTQVDPKTAVCLVVSMDKVKINFDVPEIYIGKISIGKKAEISVDAYPKEIFEGFVSKISPVVDPMTRTVMVEIIVDNPQHRLKSGMFARVKLILEQLLNQPVVPKEAIMGKQPNQYVYVVEGKKAVLRKAEFGVRSGDYVQVKKGLKENELVVVLGQQRLSDGAEVIFEENAK
ncbi:MAG: efflux RND transporter periplasmic adaptor subunit [Candidatus Omnitrophica bacterium]|nr:efflux RND transporter periplasmic adaptor subunit [Candidatus Omnitrophota bacterium]